MIYIYFNNTNYRMANLLCNETYDKFVDRLKLDVNENPKFLNELVIKEIKRSFEIYKNTIDNIDKMSYYDDKTEKYINITFADYYKKAVNTIDYENLKITCEKNKYETEEIQNRIINHHFFAICSKIFNGYSYEIKQKDNGIIRILNSSKRNLENDILNPKINKSLQYIYLLNHEFEAFKQKQNEELEEIKKKIQNLKETNYYLMLSLFIVFLFF